MTDGTTILTADEQRVAIAHGRSIREVLVDLYLERGLSQADIAAELGVSRRTVVRWMRRHGVPRGYNRSAA